MVKIIETNLLIKGRFITDHQSRVIEMNSWQEYVELFTTYDGNSTSNIFSLTGLDGNILPRQVDITDLEHDEFHLQCTIVNYKGEISKKLAYLVKRECND